MVKIEWLREDFSLHLVAAVARLWLPRRSSAKTSSSVGHVASSRFWQTTPVLALSHSRSAPFAAAFPVGLSGPPLVESPTRRSCSSSLYLREASESVVVVAAVAARLVVVGWRSSVSGAV